MMNTDEFSERWTPEPFSGCWLWIGNSNGRYGQIRTDNKNVSAHRLSWQLFKGDIPLGKQVLHRCDTPSCVNPEHLFLGTPSDNTRDSMKKGRYFRPYGERSGAAKLTEKQVEEIRGLIAAGIRQDEIAKQFGVNKSRITSIKKGTSWKHTHRNNDYAGEVPLIINTDENKIHKLQKTRRQTGRSVGKKRHALYAVTAGKQIRIGLKLRS